MGYYDGNGIYYDEDGRILKLINKIFQNKK